MMRVDGVGCRRISIVTLEECCGNARQREPRRGVHGIQLATTTGSHVVPEWCLRRSAASNDSEHVTRMRMVAPAYSRRTGHRPYPNEKFPSARLSRKTADTTFETVCRHSDATTRACARSAMLRRDSAYRYSLDASAICAGAMSVLEHSYMRVFRSRARPAQGKGQNTT